MTEHDKALIDIYRQVVAYSITAGETCEQFRERVEKTLHYVRTCTQTADQYLAATQPALDELFALDPMAVADLGMIDDRKDYPDRLTLKKRLDRIWLAKAGAAPNPQGCAKTATVRPPFFLQDDPDLIAARALDSGG